ncbi:right-handed parallel beta-helix repeat-containing protein [Acerihabitans arboris]|uniref:Right handed beta helix domain-containing protein n=1 Tax=Acerihabitans arboris TaxID=2691583 RepID=A0A845SG74_9GAMM|nr:right-handed parallel beta-helix repeat-containing protein [Acerihabitans arboris]NDL62327.1 hypothetical protein [Acerihabitans arboris]
MNNISKSHLPNGSKRIKRRIFLKKLFCSLPFFSLLVSSKNVASENRSNEMSLLPNNIPKNNLDTTATFKHILSNLFAFDGAKFIGQCPDVDALKKIIPQSPGQRILLSSWHQISPIEPKSGGGTLFAVESDKLVEDGGVVFRVNAQWCWIREVETIINAQWFGVVGDGIARVDNISAAIDYVAKNGGVLSFPAGEINFGVLRKKIVWFDGIKNFSIMGQGKSTIITFDNIDPPERKSNKNWTSEENLLSFIGMDSDRFINNIIIENLTIDYSKQRNKGGTDLANLNECHPTPHSIGTTALFFNYCLNPIIRNVQMHNIYGNGVCCRRCFYPVAENLSFYNVSANQILARDNRMDRDNSGGAVFFWSCFSGKINNCLAWNTRKYNVDYLSPDNKQQLKNTLCGYIAFWSESSIVSKKKNKAGPPLTDWISDDKEHLDTASRGVEISNCIVNGYTIGIKSETHADVSIVDNIVLNCYLPITCSGVRGVVQRNYTNMLDCENIKCPQGGLEQHRSHLGGMTFAKDESYNLSLEISHNYVRTENYPPITTNRINLKFLYNYIDMYGSASFFVSSGKGRLFGLEMRGNTFFVAKDAAPKDSVLLHNVFGTFENNSFIINSKKTPIIKIVRNINSQRIFFTRNVIIGQIGIISDAKITLSENYFSNRGLTQCIIELNGGESLVANNTFEIPRDFSTSFLQVSNNSYVIKNNEIIITKATKAPASAKEFINLISGSSNIQISGNHIVGNIDNVAFLSLKATSIIKISNNSSDGEAFVASSIDGVKAPLVIYGNTFSRGITENELVFEPNRIDNVHNRYLASLGDKINYIITKPGGREGIVMTKEGWREFGSIAS